MEASIVKFSGIIWTERKRNNKTSELIGGKPENIIHETGDLYVTILVERTRKIGTSEYCDQLKRILVEQK